ncbi:MAG: hypothetical protein FD129_931 [bacterium]|nr:MAG: hypothetical protein FD129_931 [bacterium]
MYELTFTLEPHPGEGFVRIRAQGRLTAPDMLEMLEKLTTEHPGLNRLWDFRQVDLTSWTLDDMRMYIDVLVRRAPGSPIVRVAGLVSRDIDFELARMFEELAAGTLPVVGAVFREDAEAIRWVSTRPDTLGPPAAD